jgi:bis(5'-nucleosyl)-tetraphosphatase (symmetrical)
MAVYAIGDVQGCYAALMRLLEKIAFDEAHDQLWFCGDLVNRGPDSLAVLRFVRGLNERMPAAAVTVLGNHDLHLLALAAGKGRAHNSDTLDAVLAAKDADDLLRWLRQQPLLHHDEHLAMTMVHAGLAPQWSLEDAQLYARELEAVLQGEYYAEFFGAMYGNEPALWADDLSDWPRLRFISNCFTRLRYCHEDGRLDFHDKSTPGKQAEGLLPWYDVAERKSQEQAIIFGHWSTLGLYQERNVHCLDSGCLWGGQLTALRLSVDGAQLRSYVECEQQRPPTLG